MIQLKVVHPFGFLSEDVPLPQADFSKPASIGVPTVSVVPPLEPNQTAAIELS